MKTNVKNSDNSHRRPRAYLALIIFSILSFQILNGCDQKHLNEINLTPEQIAFPTEADMNNNPTINKTEWYTQTPIATISAQTIEPNSVYDLQITLQAHQEPINVKTVVPSDDLYLYKDAVVIVHLVPNVPNNPYLSVAYLNLDNLADNGITNSDLEIEVAKEGVHGLSAYPVNNAYYFLPGNGKVDFDTCEQKFPLSGFARLDYLSQGDSFNSGNQYCFYTNEGRIAIVSYIPDSVVYTGGLSMEISVRITVFSEKLY